ncbi:MAG TPA: hypothetical protein VFM06_02740, partial [Candidatus Limnocylindria bacterium]|nr:hypothetical protein [Candidatus Limnocylindria bacterium]
GDQLQDPWAEAALAAGIPFVLAAGTALSLIAGRLSGDHPRALRHDALSLLATYALLFILSIAGPARDVSGVLFVLIVIVRMAPAGWWAIRYGAPPLFVFALCFLFYAPLAGWRVSASLPYGDQVFYLLSAERLVQGSFDASIDPRRFYELIGAEPQAMDATTHVADAPAGPRLVQGYALPLLLAPGWLAGGEVGATLVIALIAAWAATQTWLLLHETVGDRRAARVVFALVAGCAPLALAAVHVYPNALGAALIGTGYRYAFTARLRRPALAGALLGATAFLNPRDGLVVLALAPFALSWPRAHLVRAASGLAALAAAAALVSWITFGLPVPYAGYLYGTAAAQSIQPEPTWTFRFWIGLPAILFDRVFGVAGTAPWLLLAALGLVPALRTARMRLAPAAATIAASLVVLSFFRLWEGGYAPPNRYLVDVLPLAAPFVGFGLVAARGLALRGLVAVLVGVSVLVSLFLLAVPGAALNTAFDDRPQAMLDAALGLNPLGWLPSFQPVTPDWWIGAYLRLVPAAALVALLVWLGARRARV